MALFGLGKILGETYRSVYEENFKDHPDKDRIVEALVKGGNSIEQVDAWFGEANYYTWEKIRNAPRPEPNADGTVTFVYYKKGE